MGFRRVYLVGCDFEMSEDKHYWFPEQRTKRAGLEVFNCNPDSKLRVFPFADLKEAATESAVAAEESATEGMYVKRKR